MTGLITPPALGLMFVLGLRHGLDPDHVAVIDNIVFRTVNLRPRLAAWTGSLFALGHSAAVGAVAVGVALAAGMFAMPDWVSRAVDALVVLLLLAVGTMNLAALLWRDAYVPAGWRAGLVPLPLRDSTHPAATVAIGIIFGLVFDTATQAAAWGAAATAEGGAFAALVITITFASGMLIADTLDSQIVARLLRRRGASSRTMRRYRRTVGWIIVLLSFSMAGLAAAELTGAVAALDTTLLSTLGMSAAVLVVALLVRGRLAARKRRLAS